MSRLKIMISQNFCYLLYPGLAYLAVVILLTLLPSGVTSTPAWAEINEQDRDTSLEPSGLPLPRFASLKVNEVNMRTGPGVRYPIDWVLTHKGLPIEIIAEYEVWRRVRDPDGDEGWVHKSALSGKRFAIAIGHTSPLYENNTTTSQALAHLEPGALGQIISCTEHWCHLKVKEFDGYVLKDQIWGTYNLEVIK